MTRVKEYEVLENVLVITDTLEALYWNFSSSLPKELELKIKELLNFLVDYQEKEYPSNDIIKQELYRKITFKN